jgi:hypothetical protein
VTGESRPSDQHLGSDATAPLGGGRVAFPGETLPTQPVEGSWRAASNGPLLLPAPAAASGSPEWTYFDPAEPAPSSVEEPLVWIEPPYQISDRYVVDEDGELLEIARERGWARWWNGLGRNDRAFYFGSMLVFLVSTFLYCLGFTALMLTPALQPPALAVAPTSTPTPTPTPFIVGLTPSPNDSVEPTPTFGRPLFLAPTATPRFIPDEPDPTSTPAFVPPTPTRTPTVFAVGTASPAPRTPTAPAATATPGRPATTPTVPPANATYTPAPTGTRLPATPPSGVAIPTSTPATSPSLPVVPPTPTATTQIPVPPFPASPTPRP